MENEKRLIDANAIKYRTISHGGWGQPEEVADKYEIYKQPTVDAVEVVHGRWETVSSMLGYLCCSECKDVYIWETWLEDGKWNYCPNCGAKMDGDGNE